MRQLISITAIVSIFVMSAASKGGGGDDVRPGMEPMPVFRADTTRLEHMPVLRPDMSKIEPMPVLRPPSR